MLPRGHLFDEICKPPVLSQLLKIMQAIQNEDKKSAGVIQAYSDFVTVRFGDLLLFGTVLPFLDAVFNSVTIRFCYYLVIAPTHVTCL